MTNLAQLAEPVTRAAVLFVELAGPVRERLARRYPGLPDPDWAAEAVVDAVLEVARNFHEYDPTRGPVEAFLFETARQNLRTRLRGEQRRKAREAKSARPAVTSGEPAAPTTEELSDPPVDLLREVRDRIAHTETERTALTLWLDGVTAPADIARRLGYGTGPAAVKAATTLLARLRQRIHRERERRQPDRGDEP